MTPDEAGIFLINQFSKFMHLTDQTDESGNLHWSTREKFVDVIMLLVTLEQRVKVLEEAMIAMETKARYW